SAVFYRRPTKVFQDLIAQGGANVRLLRLRGASVLEGGIPIIVGGKLIGAIRVARPTAGADPPGGQGGARAVEEKRPAACGGGVCRVAGPLPHRRRFSPLLQPRQ